MPFLPSAWYYPVHLICVGLLTLFTYSTIARVNNDTLLYGKKNLSAIIVYAIVFIIVVGLRPAAAIEFGDSGSYAAIYNGFQNGLFDLGDGAGFDWLWTRFMYSCSQVMSVSSFFVLVEFLYVFPLILACKKWSQFNAYILLLFALGSFSFFAYGVNGLRNGMACSLVTLALASIGNKNGGGVLCIILCFLAIANHKSVSLPVAAMLFTYLYPKPKPMFLFWSFSILVSLVAGGMVSGFFESLGFDDRMSVYLNNSDSETMASFSRTGFRWDFLIYSFMPVLLGWFIIFKRNVPVDFTYLLLLGTYMYSNAFWIMVIRSAFSNRFAYLSWFLYPFVLGYPLLELDIIPNQGRRLTGFVLLFHFLFTLIMFIR